MKLMLNRRQSALALALAGTVGAVVWAQRMDTDSNSTGVAQAKSRSADQARKPAGESLAVSHVASMREKDPAATASANAFAPKSFYVPPPRPKVAPPPPPPPPSAPPLPFRFMGVVRESGARLHVFLSRGDRLYTVRQGEILDGDYRVEEISPEAVTFTYLPLNETQKLSITDPS